MTFAAPLEGDAAPGRVGRRRGDRRALDPRHQGAGRLHGRHAADDGATAPSSSTAPSASSSARCTARRACSSTTTRARPIPRASTCSPPASFPIAAPGSTSSSTPRTSSMCASTGAASCRRRRCCWRSGARPRREKTAPRARRKLDDDERRSAACRRRRSSSFFYGTVVFTTARRAGRPPFDPERMQGVKLTVDLIDAKTGKVDGRGRHQDDAAAGAASCRTQGLKEQLVPPEELIGRYVAADIDQRGDRRDLRRGRRRAHRRDARRSSRRRASRRSADARHRPRQWSAPISATRWRADKNAPREER